jgi:hypothetical protein
MTVDLNMFDSNDYCGVSGKNDMKSPWVKFCPVNLVNDARGVYTAWCGLCSRLLSALFALALSDGWNKGRLSGK